MIVKTTAWTEVYYTSEMPCIHTIQIIIQLSFLSLMILKYTIFIVTFYYTYTVL